MFIEEKLSKSEEMIEQLPKIPLFGNIQNLFLGLFIILVNDIQASNWKIGYDQYLGSFINYDDRILNDNISNFGVYGTELSFQRSKRGEIWVLSYYNFYRASYLGQGVQLGYNLRKTLFKIKSFHLYFDFVSGFTYLSSHYDKNPLNTAVGKGLNYWLSTRFNFEFNLASKWRLNTKLNFQHFSSASFESPNRGLNTIALGFGLVYITQPSDTTRRKRIFRQNKLWHFSIYTSLAAKEIIYGQTNKFMIYNLGFSIEKHMTNRCSFIFAFENLFNNSLKQEPFRMVSRVITTNPEDIKKIQITLGAGFALWLNKKIQFAIRAGIFIYQSHIFYRILYQRYYLRYYFHRGLFAQASLKSYFTVPDFMDFGLGIRF